VISFRYYLITIVAIFLALGLGVLAGSTVLDQGLVASLQAQTERLRADLGDLRGQVNDLRFQRDRLEEFSDAVLPALTRGTLVGRQVVVITDQGAIDDGLAPLIVAALRGAGAEVVTALRVDPRMSATTPATRQALADAIRLPRGTAVRELVAKAASALADRLATTRAQPDDVLGRLEDAGFVAGLTDISLTEIGGRGQAIVVVHGGTSQTEPAPSTFLVPLVEELVTADGMSVAAAEGLTSQPQFVEDLRASNALSGDQLVTVDDVDRAMGQIALDLGLQRLLDLGQGGDYGLKVNATDVIPPVETGA
jgi:Copper transport outer membrane protein, MctB